MSDKEFVARLTAACDSHPFVPPVGQGRQTWIKEKLGVSHEATRKYFAGLARPRPAKMALLAQVLDVDEAWLSLGVTPEIGKKDRRLRDAQASGAVNVLAGLIQMNGGSIAYPDADDSRAHLVDLYAIIKGKPYAIHVALAVPTRPSELKFALPTDFADCKVIGVVQTSPLTLDFLSLDKELIERSKERRGGYYDLPVRTEGSGYIAGTTHLDKLMALDTGL